MFQAGSDHCGALAGAASRCWSCSRCVWTKGGILGWCVCNFLPRQMLPNFQYPPAASGGIEASGTTPVHFHGKPCLRLPTPLLPRPVPPAFLKESLPPALRGLWEPAGVNMNPHSLGLRIPMRPRPALSS